MQIDFRNSVMRFSPLGSILETRARSSGAPSWRLEQARRRGPAVPSDSRGGSQIGHVARDYPAGGARNPRVMSIVTSRVSAYVRRGAACWVYSPNRRLNCS